jgi:hypothetical protein
VEYHVWVHPLVEEYLSRPDVSGGSFCTRCAGNWLKMYDKFGRILRVETVIDQPRGFRVRR